MTVDALWKELTSHDGKNDIMNTNAEGTTDTIQVANGITTAHAYTVLGTKKLSNGVRLVKMRNPWGSELYKGDWGDSSSKWTDALAKEVGLVKKDDGVFYMSIEDYKTTFAETQISFDTTGMKQGYFLRLNDDGTKADQCDASRKGPKCHRHVLNITSEVAQSVWIYAHTWDARTMPKKCQTKKGKHFVATGDMMPEMDSFVSGEYDMGKIEMGAGETMTFTGDWNWVDANYSKDWSVVAWGSKGNVTVTHKNGLKSDKLPFIEPAATTV